MIMYVEVRLPGESWGWKFWKRKKRRDDKKGGFVSGRDDRNGKILIQVESSGNPVCKKRRPFPHSLFPSFGSFREHVQSIGSVELFPRLLEDYKGLSMPMGDFGFYFFPLDVLVWRSKAFRIIILSIKFSARTWNWFEAWKHSIYRLYWIEKEAGHTWIAILLFFLYQKSLCAWNFQALVRANAELCGKDLNLVLRPLMIFKCQYWTSAQSP